MDFFERHSVSFTVGQIEVIKGYVENHPGLFDNFSHFVRCAVTRECRRLRNEGKFSTVRLVNENGQDRIRSDE